LASITAPLLALPCVLANQIPFAHRTSHKVALNSSGSERNTASLFYPLLSSPSALPEDEWTNLSHPLHPKHSVRVKKTNICNDTAK
jgi:hypothetical protein